MTLYQTLGLIYGLKKSLIGRPGFSFLTNETVDDSYLQDIAKSIAYIPGKINDTKAYLALLDWIRKDYTLHRLYEERRKVLQLRYRLPFLLLYARADRLLLTLKSFVSAVRRK